MQLENSTIPQENRLSEYDKVGVELFFSNVKFILEAFGYDIFKSIEESVSSGETYYLKGKGFDATARLLDNGGMIVLAGSLASISETPSFGGWAQAARRQDTRSGTLVEEGTLSIHQRCNISKTKCCRCNCRRPVNQRLDCLERRIWL